MTKVIGVRFRTAGKVYFFDPGKFEVRQGDHVIVETARGIEYGTVIGAPREVEDDKVVQPLKSVLRIANKKDDEQDASNKQRADRRGIHVRQQQSSLLLYSGRPY